VSVSANLGTFLAGRNAVRRALSSTAAAQVQAMRRVAAASRQYFGAKGEELRKEAELWLRLGHPPALRELCGLGDYEVPMNRILEWLFRPLGSHGAGTAPLEALADLLGLEDLRSDAQLPLGSVEIYGQKTPPGWGDSRMPDLVIRTPRLVLLIENKVHAQESGEGQYRDYLLALRRWARPEQRVFLCLMAPDERETPEEWNCFVPHAKLGEMVRCLADGPRLPVWTRIVLCLLTVDLLGDHGSANALRSVKVAVDAAQKRGIGPEEAVRLERSLQCLRAGRAAEPWRDILVQPKEDA